MNIEQIFSGGFVPAKMLEEIVRDPEEAFISKLAEFGIEVDSLAYETIERVRTKDDKRGEKSGWYIYYPGGLPAGSYGDWRNGGESLSWCFKQNHELTPVEWIENKRRMEEARKKRMAQLEAEQKAAASVAVDILMEAQIAPSNHPYLLAKGVKAHGISVKDGKLVIPAINERGEVTTIQTIDGAGNKKFLKGGKKSGSFFWLDGSRDTVYICEGYATGATIHEVTGCAVAVAFDAGNLPKVAPVIRANHMAANIIIAADNDQFKGNHNAGVKCAKEAAELISASIVVPQFSDLSNKPTDYNDLMALEGVDRVKQQLTVSPSISTPKTRFEFSRVDSLQIQAIDYVVDGYIEADSLDLIFGEPGCGKSFISIDIACCVATGTPWHGHKVKKGMVIYIAGEGHNGLARRFKAWELVNGISLEGAPIYKSHRAAQFYDQANALQVAEAVKAISAAENAIPALIIIDTVARNMGGDENSTQDMNQFIEHLDSLLRHPYKSAVLCVHHSGKASPGQARGSTALRGALDAEYQVDMDQTSRMISLANRKMKDGEVPADKKFSIIQVGLGVLDEEGEEIKGAALQTVDISGLVNEAKDFLGKNQRKAILALETMVFARQRDGIPSPVTVDDWRDSCQENGLPRNRFHEAMEALIAKNIISIALNGVILRASESSESHAAYAVN